MTNYTFDGLLDSIPMIKARDLNETTRTYREKHGTGKWRNIDAYFRVSNPTPVFRADICLGIGEPYIPDRWYVFGAVPENQVKRADEDRWHGEIRGPAPQNSRYDRVLVHSKPKTRTPIEIGKEDVSKIRKVGSRWLMDPALKQPILSDY